jgi:HD-GYP domain-containing protein (c-di-GMP phosphodiesterase class II)
MQQYVPIKVSTLKAHKSFTFDLYLLINQKYILYLRLGDDIDDKRLNRLRNDATDRVYVSSDQMELYEIYISGAIDKAINDPSMSVDDKVEIVENAAINSIEAMEAMKEEPMSETAYRMTMKAAKGLRAVVQTNPEALKKIYFQRGRNHDVILSHCKNVCVLACRLAFLMGHKSHELDNLGAAALLHDFGLNKLSQEEQQIIFRRPPEKFTPDDKRIYELHPADGVEMLMSRPYVNQVVLDLISRHEEKLSGKGYPARLRSLTQLEEILAMCNTYDKKITIFNQDPAKAFAEMFREEIGNYRLELMKKFKEVLIAEGFL